MKTGIYLDCHALASAAFAHGRDRKSEKAMRVDIAALTRQISDGAEVVVQRAYVSVRPNQDSGKFIALLSRLGYSVDVDTVPPAQIIQDVNVDPSAKMSLDVWDDTSSESLGIERVVLVTGRRNMKALAQRLHCDDAISQVEVWFFPEAVSPDLRKIVEFHEIGEDLLYGAEMWDDKGGSR